MDFQMKLNDPSAAKEYFEKKMAFTTGPAELKYFLEQGAKVSIIDVRKREDYLEGHIPGAIGLQEDDWESLQGLSKDHMNVIYCYSHVCHLAARAALYFSSRGFPVMELDGGIEAWKDYYENEIEKGESSAKVA
jgi:rhodanese-related sulfurtransferase